MNDGLTEDAWLVDVIKNNKGNITSRNGVYSEEKDVRDVRCKCLCWM